MSVPSGFVSAIDISASGDIIGANQFTDPTTNKFVFKLRAFNLAGEPQAGLENAPEEEGVVFQLKRQEDGKILAISYFLDTETHFQRTFIRFNTDGSEDTTFKIPFITKTNCFASVEALPNSAGFLLSNYNIST